jgi:hypothetical protein
MAENSHGTKHFLELYIGGRIILKQNLNETGCGLDWADS